MSALSRKTGLICTGVTADVGAFFLLLFFETIERSRLVLIFERTLSEGVKELTSAVLTQHGLQPFELQSSHRSHVSVQLFGVNSMVPYFFFASDSRSVSCTQSGSDHCAARNKYQSLPQLTVKLHCASLHVNCVHGA